MSLADWLTAWHFLGFSMNICIIQPILHYLCLVLGMQSHSSYSHGVFFLLHRLLIHDPNQRLGANGSSEVAFLFVCWIWSDDIVTALWKLNTFLWILTSFVCLQVKSHHFFKGVNWETLALQKVEKLLLLLFIEGIERYLLLCSGRPRNFKFGGAIWAGFGAAPRGKCFGVFFLHIFVNISLNKLWM